MMLLNGATYLLLLILDIGRASSLSVPLCQASSTIQLLFSNCTVIDSGQNDAHSFGVKLSIKGGGDVCAGVSTAVNTTFLTATGICEDNQLQMQDVKMDPRQCRSRRGAWLEVSEEDIKNTTDPAEIEEVRKSNEGWISLKNPISQIAHPTILLNQQEVLITAGLITGGQMSTNSHFGLADESTILDTLVEKGLIKSRSWGLNSGSQSVLFPRPGSLILGGLDQSSLAGRLYDYQVKEKVRNRWCPLQVKVTGLRITAQIFNPRLNVTETKEETLVESSNSWDAACLEP